MTTTRFADHLLEGTHAERDALTGKPTGMLFSCSDHNLIYQWDGSAWVTWATLGGGSAAAANHSVHAYATTSQSVPTSGWTAISLNSETWDTDGYHSATTNPGRITIPTGLGGRYILTGVISYAANSSGTRSVGIRLNGGTINPNVVLNAVASPFRARVSVLGMLNLAAGDYIELMGYQNSGVSLEAGDTTTTGVAGETQLGISYLG